MNAPTELQELLCEQWCADVDVGKDTAGWRISLPMMESDGDYVTVWVNPVLGGWKLRDCGTTMMRLSYGMDVDSLADGSRARVLKQLLDESQLAMENGEIVGQADERHLGEVLMKFGQAILRIGDIKLWSRSRVASTFYEDLAEELGRIVGPGRLEVDYVVPGVPKGEDYRVDFAIADLTRPLYIFGVLNTDKAKLTTIILQHLRQAGRPFDSLIVPSDIDQINKPDLRRLLNAANDFIDSSRSVDALGEKVRQRLNA